MQPLPPARTASQRHQLETLAVAQAEVESVLDTARPVEIAMRTWRGPAAETAEFRLAELKEQVRALQQRLDDVTAALARHFSTEDQAREFLDAFKAGGQV